MEIQSSMSDAAVANAKNLLRAIISDAGLSEKCSELSKSETFDSRVVEELLHVVKSGPVYDWNDEKEKLLSQVLDQNSISVIPIVGMYGIGKTTLARLVFDDEIVQGHFELKAWVTVAGQDEDIARRLLKSAIGIICPLTSKAQLDEMVSDALLSQRSLIVLDEVESINSESWMHMKHSWFRVVGMGSKVIITTRTNEVATIVSENSPFELGPLPNNACFSLFSSMTCSRSPQGDRLAARCNGLPLSLKLLGSLIRFEQSLLEDISSSDSGSALKLEWVLSLSVLALPEDLFNCFAYCALFPCGSVLEKDKLIRMWIADGAIKPSMRMSMEDTGEAYFRQLLCRSFFTDITCNEYGDVVQARMPRPIHVIAQYMAAVVYDEKINLQRFNSRGADDQTNYINLRSLDLSRSGIHSLPENIFMLIELRYLNLSHTLLTTLPESFTTNLTRLQTLDLSDCYHLKALPRKMSYLSQLTHLDLSNCNSLQYMPSEIGLLHSLRTMSLYVLSKNHIEAAGLKQLCNLNELRGVLHIRNLEDVKEWTDAEAANLKHKNLIHLVLSWGDMVVDSRFVMKYLEPNPELKVLDIRGYGDVRSPFPLWMSRLHKLVKLFINDCGCDELPSLGELPLLKELQIKGMSSISLIGPEFYGYGYGGAIYFPSMENLKLHDMPCLSRWWSGGYHSHPGAFPNLKRLSIQDCPRLQIFPSLPSVKDLVVWKSHTRILRSLIRMFSLSSVVINDMDVQEFFQRSSIFISVKKLIVIRSSDLDSSALSIIMHKFHALEHLRILHCPNLKTVALPSFGFLEKLSIVDCQILENFRVPTGYSVLTELVIEDCPQLNSIGDVESLASRIRKLIVRNCPLLSFSAAEIEMLRDLEFCYVH